MESDIITLQDIFVAKPPDEETAAAAHGIRLLSPLACTGLKPHFLEKIAANGVALPSNFFEQEEAVFRPVFAAATYGGFQRGALSARSWWRGRSRSRRPFSPASRSGTTGEMHSAAAIAVNTQYVGWGTLREASYINLSAIYERKAAAAIRSCFIESRSRTVTV
jgi:hypothetical protein